MRSTLKYAFTAVIILLAQGALDNYVNLSIFTNVALCLFIVLVLPWHTGTVVAMLAAFALGILTDVLGNGIPGMSAVAMTATALCRKGLLQLVAGGNFKSGERPSVEAMGVRSFFPYSLILVLVYLVVYVFVDSTGFTPFWTCMARIGISLVINTAIMVFLYVMIADNRKR